MDFFGIGSGELLLVLVVALVVFGPRKIPEIARGLGKTVHAFRKASADLADSVNREIELEQGQHQKPEESAEQSLPGSAPGGPDDVASPGAGI